MNKFEVKLLYSRNYLKIKFDNENEILQGFFTKTKEIENIILNFDFKSNFTNEGYIQIKNLLVGDLCNSDISEPILSYVLDKCANQSILDILLPDLNNIKRPNCTSVQNDNNLKYSLKGFLEKNMNNINILTNAADIEKSYYTQNSEEISILNSTLYNLEFENKLNLLLFIDLFFADLFEQIRLFLIMYLLIAICVWIVFLLLLEIMKKHFLEKVKFEKITSVKSITEIPISVLESNKEVFNLCENFLRNN